MNTMAVHPCTACGNRVGSEFLFEKSRDGRGKNSISLYSCKACQTVYLGQYGISYDEGLYAYYSKYQGLRREQVFSPITRKSYQDVLRLLRRHGSGNQILDVGCGKGDFVDAALAQGYSVEGIELASAAVEIARAFALPVEKVNFLSGTIAPSSVDVVTMFEVLEHLSDPVGFLRRAEEVVKPEGLIYLTTPNFDSLDRRVLGVEWSAIHREHLTYFTPKTLLAAIRNNTQLTPLHLETRNISVELLQKIRSRILRIRGKVKSPPVNDVAVTDLREVIAQSPALQLLKSLANSALNAASAGSTIVALLRRSAKH